MKDFKNDMPNVTGATTQAAAFVSTSTPEQPPAQSEVERLKAELEAARAEVQALKRANERKTKKFALLLRPSIYKAACKLQKKAGAPSLNDYIDKLLEQTAIKEGVLKDE